MKLVIDMNLSPMWVGFLATQKIEAVHWSQVGDPRATDAAIMAWAREHGYVVFTHDLDFSALLATSGAAGPSVLQVRAQNVMPHALGQVVVRVLSDHREAFQSGALVTVDETTSRVRILPVRSARGG